MGSFYLGLRPRWRGFWVGSVMDGYSSWLSVRYSCPELPSGNQTWGLLVTTYSAGKSYFKDPFLVSEINHAFRSTMSDYGI